MDTYITGTQSQDRGADNNPPACGMGISVFAYNRVCPDDRITVLVTFLRRIVPRTLGILICVTLLGGDTVPAQSILSGTGASEPADSPAQSGQKSGPSETTYTITDVTIPLSDGIALHGRLYLPAPSDSTWPTIFSMTPYTSDDAHEYGSYFARYGFAYLNVDVRGRGGSGGTFRPLFRDGADGAGVVRWITQQPWSDGQAAMRGGSYRGTVQWQTLTVDPDALRSIVPTAAVYPGRDFPLNNGIFLSYTVRWLTFVNGRALQRSLFIDREYWDTKFREFHRAGKAFQTLSEFTGVSSRTFNQWIQHPYFDEYWKAHSPAMDAYQQFDLPVLSITGYFDEDQPGALSYYRNHMQHGSDKGIQQHYLVLGPWSHGGTRNPTSTLNGLSFGDSAAIDMNNLHLQWFEWILRDGTKPEFLQNRVMYYVMGTDQWHSAPSLQAVSDTSKTFYLTSPDTNPGDPFHSGHLTAQPPGQPDTDHYIYDPREQADYTTIETIQGDFTSPGAAFLDAPKLIYHSSRMEESFELSGQMRLDAWIELDVPDTDMMVRVYEIKPTGTTLYLGGTHLRARHRHGVDTVDPVEPGTVERYQFDGFRWTARRIQQGSRIRLVISPLNHPAVQKNYHSGGPPMKESREDARTATVRLHMGPDHPSALTLPVRSDSKELGS